jgi:hypothetical protein
MILKPLYFFRNEETGRDPLNNPINELVQVGDSEGRFTSWTSEEIALDNRDVTRNNRKIITKAKAADLKNVDKVKFEGKYHDLTDIRGDDYMRWRIILVNRYGSDRL